LSAEKRVELDQLQNELDTLYLEKAKGAFIRSRARWLEEGEKNTTYFLTLKNTDSLKRK